VPSSSLWWLFCFLILFIALLQLHVSWYRCFGVQQLPAKPHRAVATSSRCLPVLGQRNPSCACLPPQQKHARSPGAAPRARPPRPHHTCSKTHPAPKLSPMPATPREMGNRKERIHVGTFRDHGRFNTLPPARERLRPWGTFVIKAAE